MQLSQNRRLHERCEFSRCVDVVGSFMPDVKYSAEPAGRLETCPRSTCYGNWLDLGGVITAGSRSLINWVATL